MPINQNHLFEELNGIKCAIVEKNVSKERTEFLKSLLEHNGYTAVVIPSAPAKATPATSTVEQPVPPAAPPSEETFTIGVTDVMFNPTNAIFGRLLKTQDGRTVTLAYWKQAEREARDDVPYFDPKT